MEFEDMKIIWDSQNEEPLFAVDEQGLQAMLRKKSEAFRRLVFCQQAQTYGSTLFSVIAVLVALVGYFTGFLDRLADNPLTPWDGAALFVGMICWALFGGRVYWARRRQKALESRNPDSLKGRLDRDIEQVDFEIKARQHLVRGYIPPYVGAGLFSLVIFRAVDSPPLVFYLFAVVMIGGIVLETNLQKRLVRSKLIPRKLELEALRDKLLQAAF